MPHPVELRQRKAYLGVEGKKPGSLVGLGRRQVVFGVRDEAGRKVYFAIESNTGSSKKTLLSSVTHVPQG